MHTLSILIPGKLYRAKFILQPVHSIEIVAGQWVSYKWGSQLVEPKDIILCVDNAIFDGVVCYWRILHRDRVKGLIFNRDFNQFTTQEDWQRFVNEHFTLIL